MIYKFRHAQIEEFKEVWTNIFMFTYCLEALLWRGIGHRSLIGWWCDVTISSVFCILWKEIISDGMCFSINLYFGRCGALTSPTLALITPLFAWCLAVWSMRSIANQVIAGGIDQQHVFSHMNFWGDILQQFMVSSYRAFFVQPRVLVLLLASLSTTEKIIHSNTSSNQLHHQPTHQSYLHHIRFSSGILQISA